MRWPAVTERVSWNESHDSFDIRNIEQRKEESSSNSSLTMLISVSNSFMKSFATAACCRILAIFAVSMVAGAKKPIKSFLRSRNLQDDVFQNIWRPMSTQFKVDLFLELQYLNDTVAGILERKYENRPQAVQDLCRCLTKQAAGPVVYRAAFEIQVNLSVPQNANCNVVDAVQLYDPEAVDIFGPGYVSLQLHLTHRVSVLSQASISLAQVTDLVSSGFQVTTGGQRLFLNCLNQYSSFHNVLAVKLRKGLSVDGATTSVGPTKPPTKRPVSSPMPPTTPPPSGMPSIFPGEATPTLADWNSNAIESSSPATAQLPSPTGSSTQAEDPPPDLRGAIGGGIATVLVTTILICCFWWHKGKRKSRHSKPNFALTTKDGQLSKADPKDTIPGFVELDQRSLAETSLGELTAGGFQRPAKANRSIPKPKLVRQTESFAENSLYTQPFSVQRDDGITYHQTKDGKFVLASQVIRDGEHDQTILYPISNVLRTLVDGVSGVSSLGPRPSSRASTTVSHTGSGTTGDGLSEPQTASRRVTHPNLARENKMNNAQRASQTIDEGSSTFDMDVWSYDYEEFDLGSEHYVLEARSRSPSHSSRSTMKVKNLSSQINHRTEKDTNREVASAHSNRLVDGGKVKRSPPDPPAQDLPNAWSRWSSMIQDGALTAGRVGQENRISSPLSKLLDSVTQAVSSPIHSNPRSIPAVTPEETESDFDHPPELSWSKEEESTLIGLQFKDEASASSASTGVSESPWLFEKVEQSLGPRSISADMESLSGRSNLSTKSPSYRSSRAGGSNTARSVGSRLSYQSGFEQNEASFAPRTLEHDLKRLEKQLEALDNDVVVSSSAAAVPSKASAISLRAGATSMKGQKMMKKLVVMVPPGRLGVILTNRHDGHGTVVSEIREFSPLYHMLSPGDILIGVDDDDVTSMVVSQIISLMASRADRERRLTVITSIAQQ